MVEWPRRSWTIFVVNSRREEQRDGDREDFGEA